MSSEKALEMTAPKIELHDLRKKLRLVRRNDYDPSGPFVDHLKTLQKGSADQGLVGQPSGREVNASKSSINRNIQTRNVNLSNEKIGKLDTVNSGDFAPFDNRKIQLTGQPAVDATL